MGRRKGGSSRPSTLGSFSGPELDELVEAESHSIMENEEMASSRGNHESLGGSEIYSTDDAAASLIDDEDADLPHPEDVEEGFSKAPSTRTQAKIADTDIKSSFRRRPKSRVSEGFF